jgi:hypothetical protein
MVEVATGRAAQEVQAMVLMAKRYPRDAVAAQERIRQACKRTGLADVAMYQYARGGTKIEGPSIRLAEVLAQSWGNIDFGLIELEQRDGESDLLSFCWDLETNTRSAKTFTVKHERHKRGGAVTRLTDPRDIYEHAANYGARRLRACILAIIPGDIQDFAVAECNKTLEGDNSEPLSDRIQKMVGLFADLGVPQEAIERRLQHKVDACNVRDIIALGKIYRSLQDGMSKREDWFDLEAAAAVESHREQAKSQREAPTPEKQAAEGSQADPAVEAGEGVDEPSEPTSQQRREMYEGQIGEAKKLGDLTAIDGELGADIWISEEDKGAVTKQIEAARVIVRSSSSSRKRTRKQGTPDASPT